MRRGQLSARQLQKDYQSVYRNVYLPKGTLLTALTRARAAWLWSAGEATLVGLSAAAVLGTKWIDPQAPAELSRADRHSPKGIVAHTYDLTDDECRLVDGMRITTPVRTAFDIGRSMRRDHAVVHLDALTHATDLKIREGRLKELPKRLARRLLPKELELDRKQGFAIPLENWIARDWHDSSSPAQADRSAE